MYTDVVFEVRWIMHGTYVTRSMKREFPDAGAAKDWKHEQAAKHPDRRYTVVKITTEEVA